MTRGPAERVVITGLGVVTPAVTGGAAALGAYLARPETRLAPLASSALAGVLDPDADRRLSPASQLAVAAARLAAADAACTGSPLGVVLGTELGDLGSTADFADGYLARGRPGVSPLVFPNTVMNAMASAAAIALSARELSLTINAPVIAGELAVSRAAAAVAGRRVERVLAGGVDRLPPAVPGTGAALAPDADRRGEGAAFIVLESASSARMRGVRVLGEVLGAASGALRARPLGVGRDTRSPVVARALARAGVAPRDVGFVYSSASGDAARDNWERALIEAALAPARPPVTALSRLMGHHAGLGVLRVAAAAWTARAGLLPLAAPAGDGSVATAVGRVGAGPGLVHGVARGGGQVALVVGRAE